MANLETRLKSLGMDVSESFLVQFIVNSLALEFGQFQVNYNTLKEKQNLQEIKAMLVQEEEGLKKMKEHSVHLTFHKEASNKANLRKKDKRKNKGTIMVNKGQIHKELKCYFCKKASHFKIDCPKKKDLVRKERYILCFSMF